MFIYVICHAIFFFYIFFFKQKTAYEMRISDWSSDVCSSDLIFALLITWPFAFDWMRGGGNILNPVQFFADALAPGGTAAFLALDMAVAWEIGRAACRERVGQDV